VTLNWPDVAQLSVGDLQAVLLDELSSVMSGLFQGQQDEMLETLPAPMRVLWLLDWLDFEVTQGSLLAYFGNSHGRYAWLAAAALDEIGAVTMSAVLRRAAGLHAQNAQGRKEDARDQDVAEYAVLRPYSDWPHADELRTLTTEFHAAEEADDWGQKLDVFLRAAVGSLAKLDESAGNR